MFIRHGGCQVVGKVFRLCSGLRIICSLVLCYINYWDTSGYNRALYILEHAICLCVCETLMNSELPRSMKWCCSIVLLLFRRPKRYSIGNNSEFNRMVASSTSKLSYSWRIPSRTGMYLSGFAVYGQFDYGINASGNFYEVSRIASSPKSCWDGGVKEHELREICCCILNCGLQSPVQNIHRIHW